VVGGCLAGCPSGRAYLLELENDAISSVYRTTRDIDDRESMVYDVGIYT
jgi:hypothetical protein